MSDNDTSTTTPWRKATASSDSSGCAELRRHGGFIEVRDTKDPDGPVLRFTPHEARCLFDGVTKGEFDPLTQD